MKIMPTRTQTLPTNPKTIAQAAGLIRAGELVAFPTETVYGLGADALNPRALAKIFTAKGRPTQDPLIVHIHSINQLDQLASEVPDEALTLMEALWPGPLTLVLPKTEAVPGLATAGLPSVAVRMPNHPVALALLRGAGMPIAAPSANLFGHTSPTTASHVLADLDGRLPLILDGGPCPVGVESTVLHLAGERPLLLRPGGVSREQIEALIGPVAVRAHARHKAGEDHPEQAETQGLPSPGLLARHYAPRTPLTFLPEDHDGSRLLQTLRVAINAGENAGAMVPDEEAEACRQAGALVYLLGPTADHATLASAIFAALRYSDGAGVQAIYAHGVPPQGLGLAINDRLTRAAETVI